MDEICKMKEARWNYATGIRISTDERAREGRRIDAPFRYGNGIEDKYLPEIGTTLSTVDGRHVEIYK